MATELPTVPTVYLDELLFFSVEPTTIDKQCGLHRHHTLTRREEMCGLSASSGTSKDEASVRAVAAAAGVGRHREALRKIDGRKDAINTGQRMLWKEEFCWLHS